MNLSAFFISAVIAIFITTLFMTKTKRPMSKADKIIAQARIDGTSVLASLVSTTPIVSPHEWNETQGTRYHTTVPLNTCVYSYVMDDEQKTYKLDYKGEDIPAFITLYYDPAHPDVLYDTIGNFAATRIDEMRYLKKHGSGKQVLWYLAGLIVFGIIYQILSHLFA